MGRSQNCAAYMGSGRGWLAGDWPSTGGVLNITAAAWSAGFHWWRSGNITRTQNVSDYMLVLALCLVVMIEHKEPTVATKHNTKTRMWADAQRDGRPAEYRWHPFLTHGVVFMVALCNRADHNIFMLFLLSSFFFLLLLLFFPRLISAVGDWMFTILWHMVWP